MKSEKITLLCRSCCAHLKIGGDQCGKVLPCPECGGLVEVPLPGWSAGKYAAAYFPLALLATCSPGIGEGGIIIGLGLLPFLFQMTVNRLKRMGWSGWWSLLILLGPAFIVFPVILCCFKGEPELAARRTRRRSGRQDADTIPPAPPERIAVTERTAPADAIEREPETKAVQEAGSKFDPLWNEAWRQVGRFSVWRVSIATAALIVGVNKLYLEEVCVAFQEDGGLPFDMSVEMDGASFILEFNANHHQP